MAEYITLSELSKFIKEKDHIKIEQVLTKFKKTWNKLIPELKKKEKITLNNLNLRGKDVSGVDLSDVVIEDSDFGDSDLSESDLSNTVISGVNFNSASLEKTKLYSARITQSNMSHTRMYRDNIKNIRLTGSVNLFDVYLDDDSPRYSTDPEITKKGFRIMEAVEHEIEHEEDNYY